MEMTNQFSAVIICFLSLTPLIESTCTRQQCNSNTQSYTNCSILNMPNNTYIVSMKVYMETSINKCIMDTSYGFYPDIIWVRQRCKATFDVCYVIHEYTTSHLSEPRSVETTVSSPKSVLTLSTTPSHNTSVPILKNTDQQSSSGAGIAGGVVGAIIVVIILLIAVLFVRRRFPEFFKKKPIEQHFNHNNYIGNQNVAFVLPSEASIYNNITDYSMLGSTRDQHYYQRISDSQNEATGSEPHTYVTLYDSLEGRNLSCSCDTDEITTYEEPVENRKSRDVDQQQKQYDYANLAAENPTDNTNIVNEYAILDPGVTGFDRRDIETCDDLQIYELAKPITEVSEVDKTSQEDDSQYMPSVEGVYDHAHNNRHKKPINNIYDKKTNNDYEKPTMNKNESHESTYYNT